MSFKLFKDEHSYFLVSPLFEARILPVHSWSRLHVRLENAKYLRRWVCYCSSRTRVFWFDYWKAQLWEWRHLRNSIKALSLAPNGARILHKLHHVFVCLDRMSHPTSHSGQWTKSVTSGTGFGQGIRCHRSWRWYGPPRGETNSLNKVTTEDSFPHLHALCSLDDRIKKVKINHV